MRKMHAVPILHLSRLDCNATSEFSPPSKHTWVMR